MPDQVTIGIERFNMIVMIPNNTSIQNMMASPLVIPIFSNHRQSGRMNIASKAAKQIDIKKGLAKCSPETPGKPAAGTERFFGEDRWGAWCKLKINTHPLKNILT